FLFIILVVAKTENHFYFKNILLSINSGFGLVDERICFKEVLRAFGNTTAWQEYIDAATLRGWPFGMRHKMKMKGIRLDTEGYSNIEAVKDAVKKWAVCQIWQTMGAHGEYMPTRVDGKLTGTLSATYEFWTACGNKETAGRGWHRLNAIVQEFN
ncbi:hypothetical protein ACJX0J_027097, partial [Zea mays]